MTYSKNDSSAYIFCYIGAFMFIGASLAGVVAFMPDLQLAMSMRDRPDSMSLSYFIENGPNDNAFVRLTDVEVDLDNSYEIISTTRRRGFRTSHSSGVIANLYPLNLERTSPIIAMRAPQSYEEAWDKAVTQGIVEGRILPKMASDSIDRMKSHINSNNVSSVRWTIEPLKRRPELKQSRLNLLYALLIGALGLAIANLGASSGGTLASFISYLGAPLRVRPFNMMWPGVYIVAGVALLGSSYETTFEYGKLGNIYFNGLMLSLGYMMAQVGLGAIVSAVLVPGLYYLFDEASASKPKLAAEIQVLESTPPKLPVPSARLPYTTADFRGVDYRDPVVMSDAPVAPASSGAILQADRIPEEFLGPMIRQFQTCDDSGEASCQLFLGCAGLMMTEQFIRDGKAEVRLFSLLGDGLMIATTHQGNTLVEQTRQGSTALVQIVEAEIGPELMIKLVDAHLAKCERLRSVRGTRVEAFDQEDAENVWLYARRAVAEMRFQYGLSELEVHPKALGRFHYPTGPVSDLAKDASATRTDNAGTPVVGV